MEDAGSLTYKIMVMQGVGMLFPWNVFITAEQYFHVRLCGSPYEASFENYFTFSFTAFNVLTLIYTIMYQSVFSQKFKVYVSLVVLLLVFGWLTLSCLIEPDSMGPDAVFYSTLLGCIIAGTFTAFLQDGVFALGGKLPMIHTQGAMTGQAIAGLVVALSGVFTMLLGSANSPADECDILYDDVKWSSFLYFGVSVFVLFIALVSYYYLEDLPYVRYHVENQGQVLSDEESGRQSSHSGLLDGGVKESMNQPFLVPGNSVNSDDSDLNDLTKLSVGDNVESFQYEDTPSPIFEVFMQIRSFAIAVWLTYAATLAIFPGVTTKIRSTTDSDVRFFTDLFVPISFVTFNLGDFIGRVLAGYKIILAPKNLWIGAVARLAYIPLFLLCNVKGSEDNDLPTLFENDFWPIFFMLTFATTNGYFGSCLMMTGPGQVESKDLQTASTMMVLCLTFGLLTGTLVSFAFVPLIP